ncbi:hypothetical protein ACFW84_09420 [Streptomyces anulatus]|uniref:hypothetical protein n=1 Tax=Streptomyces anulatus TaxID=1892 RepID=UPI0036C9434C
MGLEFGHDLGLRRALRGLPLSPLVTGYRHLLAQQQALGLRHIGDALVERGRVLRVLDGLFEEGAGRRWQHIGPDRLRRMGALRGEAYRPFLARLETVQLQDPAALRRILLYQLVELLQAHPRHSDTRTAVSLGVCPTEAAALVRAAAACHHLTDEQRRAAEELEDAWDSGKVRRAALLVALLPAGGGGDALLRRRFADIDARVEEADNALDAAREAEQSGDARAAEDGFLKAARLASDCPRARLALVRLHRPAGHGSAGPGAVLTTRHMPEAVAVSLHPSPLTANATPDRHVVRLTRVPGAPAGIAEIPGASSAVGWVDRDPPLGQEVRYAVFPLRDGLVDGPPVVSDVLLVAPDVSALRSTTGPGRIDAAWTEPSGALDVRVVLEGPDGPVDGIEVRPGALTATGLNVGTYVLRVHCRYRSPDATVVESAGTDRHITVNPWPTPVHRLDATVGRGSVQFSWSGGQNADVRLVSWPADPPEPGTELTHDPATPWPAPLSWEAVADGLAPPPGSVTRVSALAVLGPHAVAGPGLLVECPPAVAGARVERVAGGRARITFDWPAETGQVMATVEQDGANSSHRVTRSTYVREGLYVDVPPSAFTVALSAAPRTTDAVVVPAPGSATAVPAEISVSYRIVPGPRRRLRRGPALLRVALSCAGEAPDRLPEFVLVARAGGGRAPIRPLDHTDGTTLLRLDGGALSVGRPVELPVPTDLRPPYVLRGFLLGDGAADVRLDEPSPPTLVVR